MPDCQVTCITKPHPQSRHEHITHLGNPPDWIWPREQVISSIEAKTNTFYVRDPRTGKRADISVCQAIPTRFSARAESMSRGPTSVRKIATKSRLTDSQLDY